MSILHRALVVSLRDIDIYYQVRNLVDFVALERKNCPKQYLTITVPDLKHLFLVLIYPQSSYWMLLSVEKFGSSFYGVDIAGC